MTTYPSALRTTLRATAAAYGYTLAIGTTAVATMDAHGSPTTGDLFLFVGGGLAGFAILEMLLQLLGSKDDESPEHTFPFAGALNLLAVSIALAGAVLVVDALDSALVWLLAPMTATILYMLLVAVQVTFVARLRSR